jgi:flavin-dependent dehydrogenase
MSDVFDVAIIGGGLAGCNAAITLAQQGRRVVLLEAGEYPRHKVCGEFLSPECAALFAETGFLDVLRTHQPTQIQTVRLTAPDRTEWCTTLPTPAVGVSRYMLDAALADYAAEQGMQTQTKARVTKIEGSLSQGFRMLVRDPEGLKTVHSRSVIAAHGKRSTLDRTLSRAFLKQPQPFIGLKRHFRGSPLPHHLDLHIFPGGYCGMSEVEDGTANICLLVRQEMFQRATSDTQGDTQGVDRFIEWMCSQNPALGAWLSQASPVEDEWLSISQIPFINKGAVKNDILFAGDAAGMIAPLAGDGMAMALHGGKLAAQSVGQWLDGKVSGDQMLHEYAQTWQQTFAMRLRLGRVLQSIMLRPALLSPGLRLINLMPKLGDFIVTQTRDLKLANDSRTMI